MARIQGIAGGMSGKMGSVVFRQDRGATVVAQYQPQVKNPNTAGQQAQRAKFKLMTQLAAIMSPAMGTISVAERPARQRPSQRNAFVQKNFQLVEASETESGVVAKIPMEQLQLTSSFRTLPALSLNPVQGAIQLDMLGISPDVSTIRVILVDYKGSSAGQFQAQINQIVDYPVSDEGDISAELENLAVGNYTVLAYGLIPSESLEGVDLDNIHTPADEDFISAIRLDQMVRANMMAETMTVGSNVAVV